MTQNVPNSGKLPIVTTDLGGCEIIDHDKDEIITDFADTKDWIMRILTNEERAAEIGKNARQKILDKFSLEQMVDGHIKLYNEVIEK